MELSLRLSDAERDAGKPSRALVLAALRHLDVFGVVLIENVLAPDLAAELPRALERYRPGELGDVESDAALRVGDRRFLFTVPLEGVFGDPRLFALPALHPILVKSLSHHYVLGSFGAVVSLPGAKDQHVHTDHPRLFYDDRIDGSLPPHSVTAILPAIQLDESTGATLMYLGSHRMPKALAHHGPRAVLYGGPGSVILMEGRLMHHGTANTSDRERTILYLEYCRPWFQDFVNYRTQKAVIVPGATLRSCDARQRALLARGREINDERVSV